MSNQIQHLISELSGETRQVRNATLQILHIGTDTVDPLIDALSSDLPVAVQERIIFILSKIGDQCAMPILTTKFNDNNYHVGYPAKQALLRFHSAEPFLNALHSNDEAVRERAINALGELGDKQYASLLINALNDPSSQVRCAAISALHRLHIFESVKDLVKTLADSVDRVRDAAFSALLALNRDALFEAIRPWLDSDDSTIQRDALLKLEYLRDSRSVAPALSILKDKDEDPLVRALALHLLMPYPSPETREAALQALSDPDSHVRSYAANTLRAIGNSESIQPLIQSLKDKNQGVRATAADALGELGDQSAIDALTEALQDKKEHVRWHAAQALARLKAPQTVEVFLNIMDIPAVEESIAYTLARSGGPQIVDRLIDALRSDNPNIVTTAAKALGLIRDERSIEPLITMSNHFNDRTRWAVAEALSQLPSSRAAEALVPRLNDNYLPVRLAAIQALWHLDVDHALDLLTIVLRQSSEQWEQAQAIHTIARVGGLHAVQRLIAVLRDETSAMRFEAAIALGRLGDEQAVETLIWALRESQLKHPRVDTRAAWALGKMQARQAVPDLITTLWEALDLEDFELMAAVTEALGKLADRRAVDPVIQVLQARREDIRIHAVSTLRKIRDPQAAKPLAKALQNASREFQHVAMSALSQVVGEDQSDILLPFTANPDPRIRLLAVQGLSRIGDERAISVFIQALNEKDYRLRKAGAQGLAHVGPRALPMLFSPDLTQSPNPLLRRRLVWILGEIRDKSAVEHLIFSLETDSDTKVRAYAAQALGKIRDTNCLQSLLKALSDNAGAVRAAAAAALGQIGLSKVSHALFPLLNDSDENVRRAAAYSLLRLTKG